MGGGVSLPHFPVKKTITPSGGDDTAAIQAAIDEVSHLPLTNGVRGAVLLAGGHFHCSATLKIAASGVVLTGNGSGERGTVIEMTGDPHLAFSVAGESRITPVGDPVTVADAYVPSGAMELSVRNASGLKPGDRVQIVHPLTPEWVHRMGMDTLVRNGKKEIWVGNDLKTERTIVAMDGKKLRFDVPLADSYDAKFLGPTGATVVKVEESGAIEQVGVENLRLVAPARAITLNDKPFNGQAADVGRLGCVGSQSSSRRYNGGCRHRQKPRDGSRWNRSTPPRAFQLWARPSRRTSPPTGRRFSSTDVVQPATVSSISRLVPASKDRT